MEAGHDENERRRAILLGSWVKDHQAPEVEPYPDHLEFTDRGIFFGSNNPTARYHPIWDTGRYELLTGDKIRIPSANDAVHEYSYRIEGDKLLFDIQGSTTIQYRRKP